jgi:hypothetical protein
MASRRKLKQTIRFVSSELINDIYFHCLMSKEIDTLKVDRVTEEVMALQQEFILRANHPDGKENSAFVKAYFRKLYSDWQIAMEKILKEIDSL